MSDEMDPEVFADIQLREASQRDAKRTRGFGVYSWSGPEIIATVACRAGCGNRVEWTQEAEDRLQDANRILARKCEAPIDRDRVCFCEACKTKGKSIAAQSNRRHVDALAELIRQLKASSNPDGEHELIEKIKAMHHPDVKGLLDTLQDRRRAGKTRPSAKDVLR